MKIRFPALAIVTVALLLSCAIPPASATVVPVRILSLGDSITYGVGSSDGNGYRAGVDAHLQTAGQTWQMVGTQTTGTMTHRNHEGWPGFTIVQIMPHVTPGMVYPPASLPASYVLLDAGTNDVRAGHTAAQIEADMTTMLSTLLAADPNVRVIVAQITITVSQDAWRRTQEQAFDQWLPSQAGPRVRVVDMRGVQLGTDGTHPNDGGYTTMANRWWAVLATWMGVPV